LQREAVEAQLRRLRLPANAERGAYPHRVKITPQVRLSWPKVSILIPTKDSPDVLGQCLYSLFSKTNYPTFDVLCIDNSTTDERAIKEMRDAPVERILFPGVFNFSKANNLGVTHATGEYLVFMNNDIEVITDDWIEQMLYYAEQPDVGAVGGLLLYPDGTVQHAGVVLGCRGTADHLLRGWPGESDGYAGSLSCAHEVSAVTAACMMMRREIYEAAGGFSEYFFTAYQDVDLCLKVRERRKRIIFTPHARFVHHESASRGKYYDHVDRNLLLDYWEPLIKAGDPYYNRNFDVQACNYSVS
jgi:GT2 family glycosyltransferase